MSSTMKTTNKGRYKTAPLIFKLKLISEVRKHGIIWQNINERKNKDLLEDAWKRVKKALLIKEAGYCEKQWKLLLHKYRCHVNKRIAMRADLAEAMAFMEPQIKKAPIGVNANKSVECEHNKQEKTRPEAAQKSSDKSKEKCRTFLANLLDLSKKETKSVHTDVRKLIQQIVDAQIETKEFCDRLQRALNASPHPDLVYFLQKNLPPLRQSLATKELVIEGIDPPAPRVASMTTGDLSQPIMASSNTQMGEKRKSNSSEESASARRMSLAIVDHLFDSMPADAMTQVCDVLQKVLHQLRPNLESEILEYGSKQPESRLLNPDWSGLAVPPELCQEIWRREVQKRLLLSFQAGSKKH